MAGLTVGEDLDDQLFRRGLASHIEGGWRFVHGMLRESLERSARKRGEWRRYNRICARLIADRYGADNRQTAERRASYLLEAGEFREALGPLLDAARKRFEQSDFQNADREDDNLFANATVSRRLTRTFFIDFSWRHSDRSSSDGGFDFTENRYTLTLRFDPD